MKRKEIHTVAEGSAVSWQNCFDPKRKDIHDIEYVREAFMDALKKSNEKANGKRKKYHGLLAHYYWADLDVLKVLSRTCVLFMQVYPLYLIFMMIVTTLIALGILSPFT